MTTACLEAALRLGAQGIPTFPCVANEKRPLTPRGLHDASSDAGVIDAWFKRWPRANLALPTGHRSGLLVVDLDCKHGVDGRATLRSLEVDLGVLPATRTASTPSGGEHRFFRMPTAQIRNSAGKLAGFDAPGFDVRSDGGYVVIAPSAIEGVAYQWTDRTPPAELPTAWVRVLETKREHTVAAVEPWAARDDRDRSRVEAWCLRALQTEARELATTPAGARNDRLWRAAAAIGGLVHTRAIDADDVRRALAWACSRWGTRTPKKDQQTLENGLAFGIAHPRHLPLGVDRAA